MGFVTASSSCGHAAAGWGWSSELELVMVDVACKVSIIICIALWGVDRANTKQAGQQAGVVAKRGGKGERSCKEFWFADACSSCRVA
jgi:hypothetical protein